MNILHAIFLGLLQGFTEFLPVSSSGHLVLAQNYLPGFDQPGILFDVILHAGTLSAIIIFYYREIVTFRFKYLKMLIIGTIPAVIIGLVANDFVHSMFESTKVVGFALILTAVFNYATDNFSKKSEKLTEKKALFIGVFQALAITPGLSRSGSTIFAGVKSGLTKEEAAKYSFLLSVPAIIGANLLEIIKYTNTNTYNIQVLPYFLGFLAALFAGLLAIRLAIRFLTNNKFKYFSYYCLVLGIVVLIT